MSTATVADASPPAKGKKKLILIVVAALLVVLLGGGAAMLLLKKKAVDPEAEADDDGHAASTQTAKHDPHAVPVFVPLDSFTVNLADREAERYAQVGITLEIDDAKTGEQIKLYMPAIRNNILMAIADRTAVELMGREGKAKLAEKIRRETARALGFEVEADAAAAPAGADDEDETAKTKAKAKKKPKKRPAAALPVKAVHFSNFILQ